MARNIAVDTYITKCEKEVLTNILTTANAVDLVVASLDPEDFVDDKNRAIYRAIYDLAISAKQITKNNIADFIANNEDYQFDNWSEYLEELAIGYAFDEDLKANLEIIKNASIKRHLDVFANQILSTKIDFAQYNNQIFALTEKFMDIVHSKKTGQLANMDDVSKEFMKHMVILRERSEDITGTAVGFDTIDRVTNGFQPGDLIILAARPGVGKTAIALNFAKNAAEKIKADGKAETEKVVIFSLEMGKEQLYQRLVSMETSVPSNNLRSGKMGEMEWASVQTAASKLAELPILIDDIAGENIIDIQSKLKQLKTKYNIKLVIVDYIQLMHGPRIKGMQVNRQQEVSTISRMLKLLAREIKAPIIGLAQLSRAAEESPDKTPQLSHLRESGALEQDADLVCFLHKEVTAEETASKDDIKPATYRADPYRRIKFIIAKHRNGELKTVDLLLTCASGLFQELNKPGRDNYENKESIVG